MRITEDDGLRRWRETVHAFMDDEIGVDYCRERYQERAYPHELYDGLVERDWLGTVVPEEHGGRGDSWVELVVLLEALGKYGYDFGVPVLVAVTATENLLRYGTDEQRARFVEPFLAGETRFSIGVTEPDSGSDAASLSTTARREGDEYVVNGEKTYQSGADAPGNVIHAYVRTDPDAGTREGISALLIPTDADGVETTRLPLVARKASGTCHVSFDDVRVPAANLVGAEGQGWEILNHHLVREHTGMAALMAGNAQTAIDLALDVAADRERFGRQIADFQAVGHRLADAHTEVEAARLLVSRAASAIERGQGSRRLAAQAKLKAGETLQDVAQTGMQVLGGAGLDPENDMERYWREGASATIAGATSEIHRSVILDSLLD